MAELTPKQQAKLRKFAEMICGADVPAKFDPDEIFAWLKDEMELSPAERRERAMDAESIFHDG